MTLHFLLVTRRGNYAFIHRKLTGLLQEAVEEYASMYGELILFEYGVGSEAAYRESVMHFVVRFIEPVNPSLWVRRLKAICDRKAQEAKYTSRLWYGGCMIKDISAYTDESALRYAGERIGRQP